MNLVTFEDAGPRTKWKLVARFNSLAERDFAKGMGFAEMISQGSEKLNDIMKHRGVDPQAMKGQPCADRSR